MTIRAGIGPQALRSTEFQYGDPYQSTGEKIGDRPVMGTRRQRLPALVEGGMVQLSLVEPAAVEMPHFVERYVGMLNSGEKERYERFRFPRHRHEYLVTRALVRTELSLYSSTRPDAWQFTTNTYGRPELDGHPEAAWLRFSLSNTAGLVACATTRNAEIGVDVENVTCGKPDIADLADRFFSPNEIRELRALPPELRQSRFFEYWTLKEAYVKARGTGLTVSLNSLTFYIETDGRIRVEFDATVGDNESLWGFRLIKPTPCHQLALAVRREGHFDLRSAWVMP